MKKILALITAIMLAISCMGVSFAEETEAPEVSVTVEAPAAEETPAPAKEETPVVEETLAEKEPEQPAQEAPAAEQTVEEQTTEEVPVVEQSVEEQPVEEAQAAEQSVEEQPAEEAPAVEQPVEEQPAEEAPAAEQPVEEQPVEEAPAAEQPVEEQPADEALAAEQPVEEQPAEETPAAEQPVEEQPAEEAPAAEQPATEEPADEAPAEEQPEEEAKHFVSGYVYVPAETKLYNSDSGRGVYGVVSNGNTVYAEISKTAEDPAEDWVRLTFSENGDVAHAFVCVSKVRVQSVEFVDDMLEEAKENKESVWLGETLINALAFVREEAAEEVTEIVPEATVEEETVETVPEVTVEDETTATVPEVIVEETVEEVLPEETELPEVIETAENVSSADENSVIVTAEKMTEVAADTDAASQDAPDEAEQETVTADAADTEESACVEISEADENTAEAPVDPEIAENAKAVYFNEEDVFTTAAIQKAEILTQPVNFYGSLGDTIVFSVEAQGDGLTYVWKSRTKGRTAWSNAKMTGKDTSSMTGELTAERLNYEYACQITDKYGNTVMTDAVWMAIYTPIEITVQPSDVETAAGETTEFAVQADGCGLTYGNTVTTDTVCMLTGAQPDGPKILTQPVNYTGSMGEVATFTVEAQGDGLTYRWMYRLKGKTAWTTAGMDGALTASTSGEINTTRLKNEYCCEITDKYGTKILTDIVCMELGAQPVELKILTQPVNYIGNVGDTATFSVEAQGDGLTYCWKFRAKGSTKWANAGMDGKLTATMSGEMTVDRLKNEYCCEITDAYGTKVLTDIVCMEVGTEPTKLLILTQPMNGYGSIGDTIEFAVEAQGDGLTYVWKSRTKGRTAWSNAKMTGKDTAIMTGELTAERLNYEYACQITDMYGNTVMTDAVCMKLYTPVVITEQPQDMIAVAGDEVSFSVTAEATDAELLGITYYWEYRLNGTDEWTDAECDTNTYTFVADRTDDGLMVRCTVIDAFGVSAVSDEAVLSIPFIELVSCEVTGPSEVTLKTETNITACAFNVYEGKESAETLAGTYETAEMTVTGLTLGQHVFRVDCVKDGKVIASCEVSTPVLCTITEVDDLVYELYEKNGSMYLAVIAYNGTASTLEVPATVEGYTVNKIGEGAFEGNTTLTAIDLPDAIEVIGARAFKGCSNLKSMN